MAALLINRMRAVYVSVHDLQVAMQFSLDRGGNIRLVHLDGEYSGIIYRAIQQEMNGE